MPFGSQEDQTDSYRAAEAQLAQPNHYDEAGQLPVSPELAQPVPEIIQR
jgi:hypothetical protein